MEGKRVKVWLLCPGDRPHWQAQWLDPASGRRRTRSLGTADEAEARRKRADLEYELAHGLAQGKKESGPVSWAEFMARYEKEKLAGARPRSAEKARQVLALFAARTRPGRLASVDERMVAAHAESLRGEGRRPATVAAHLAYLRAALRWAARGKLLKAAPHVEMPAVPGAGRRPHLDEAGYERLLAAMPTPAWRLLLRVAWHTGARRNELLALTWDGGPEFPHADLPSRRLVYPPGFTKAGRARWQPIHPELMAALRRVPARQRTGKLCDPGCGMPQDASKEFSRLAREAGLPGIGLHAVRRGFASRYAPRVEAAVLQRLMDHADVRTTLRFYADVDSALEEAIRKA